MTNHTLNTRSHNRRVKGLLSRTVTLSTRFVTIAPGRTLDSVVMTTRAEK
jgi:hypothetical protein